MIVFGFIDFLKGNAGLVSLVGDRVFPRRLDNQPTLPALVVHKISEVRETEHSGDSGVRVTRLQVDVFAKTVAEVEIVKKAVGDLAHAFSGAMGTCTAQTCFLEDDADLFQNGDDEFTSKIDEFGGTMDFFITWHQ